METDFNLPLLQLPEFKSETYKVITSILKLTKREMATRFLTTLLQTQIRNNEFLANIPKKSGPQRHTYAAKTTERLPINPKPRVIPPNQPISETKFPCTRCLITATILTTTNQKYTKPLNLKPRFKSTQEFSETLPQSLRPTFNSIFNELTQGFPNHSETRACPFASQPEIRQNFHRIAPNKHPLQSNIETYKSVVQACKNCNLCAKCGRPRNLANERAHQTCSTNYKQCPARKTQDCKSKTCNHPIHPLKSIWRTDEVTLVAEPKLLEKSQTHHFQYGRRDYVPSLPPLSHKQ